MCWGVNCVCRNLPRPPKLPKVPHISADDIVTAGEDVVTETAHTIGDYGTKLYHAGEKIAENTIKAAKNAGNTIANGATHLYDDAKGLTSNIYHTLKDATVDIVHSVVDAADDLWLNIRDDILVPIIEFVFCDILGFEGDYITQGYVHTQALVSNPVSSLEHTVLRSVLSGANIADNINKDSQTAARNVHKGTSMEYTENFTCSIETIHWKTVELGLPAGATEVTNSRVFGYPSVEVRVWKYLLDELSGIYGDKTVKIDGDTYTVKSIDSTESITIEDSDGNTQSVDVVAYPTVKTISYKYTKNGKVYMDVMSRTKYKNNMVTTKQNDMFPVYTLRSNGKNTTDTNILDQIAKTGINPKSMIDSIVSTDDQKKQIQCVYLTYCIDLYSDNEVMKKLIFNWAEILYNNHKEYTTTTIQDPIQKAYVTYKSDGGYSTRLLYDISRKAVMKVDSDYTGVKIELKKSVMTVSKIVSGYEVTYTLSDMAVVTSMTIQPDDSPIKLALTVPKTMHEDNVKDEDGNKQQLLIPIGMHTLDGLRVKDKEIAIQIIRHLEIYAGEAQYLEWYQTEEFGNFMEFVEIVIFIVTLGSGSIVLQIMERMATSYVLGRAMEYAAEHGMLGDLIILVIIVAIAYGDSDVAMEGMSADQLVDSVSESMVSNAAQIASKSITLLGKYEKIKEQAELDRIEEQNKANEEIYDEGVASIEDELSKFTNKYNEKYDGTDLVNWMRDRAKADVKPLVPITTQVQIATGELQTNTDVLYETDRLMDTQHMITDMYKVFEL